MAAGSINLDSVLRVRAIKTAQQSTLSQIIALVEGALGSRCALERAVDRVSRVVKVTPGEVEPHPVVHASEQSEAIRGVFRQANALTILLDLDKLLDGRAVAAS